MIKATAIDPTIVGEDGVYRHRGPARVFVSERAAIEAVKGGTARPIEPGDVLVLIGGGPSGTGMQETAQITSALKYLPWGKHVPILTDARFSGFSTGACVGHVGPEALAGGPIGKLRDDDLVEVTIDRKGLSGRISLVGTAEGPLAPEEAAVVLRKSLAPSGPEAAPATPGRYEALGGPPAGQRGMWSGCVYDVDRIIAVIEAAWNVLAKTCCSGGWGSEQRGVVAAAKDVSCVPAPARSGPPPDV